MTRRPAWLRVAGTPDPADPNAELRAEIEADAQAQAAAEYAGMVVGVLLAEFPDVRSQLVQKITAEAVAGYHYHPYPHFEVLLNGTGTWRLKPCADRPGRVRLADYSGYRTERPTLARVNDLLDSIHLRHGDN